MLSIFERNTYPQEIISNLSRIGKQFRKGREEDSHEFLIHLLDALSADGIIKKLFNGQLKSTITPMCGHKSSILDTFNILSLVLK